MTTLTVTEAKAHFLDMIRGADKRLERYVITRQGKPAAVVMSADEYEGWLETIAIMSDKRAMKALRQSIKEIKEGKVVSFEEVTKRRQKR